ncbi:MAG: hypothetical protein MJ182_07350 [Treponema sp.]|nr:hypothetical protein [Treponema sp.]
MQMIKPGALRLKKFNFKMVKRLFNFWGAVSLLILVFSCKSASSGFPVNPLELFDEENGFFIVVPKQADISLIQNVISENFSDLSEKDLETALSRIEKAYIGLANNKSTSTYQCAVSCNIPVNFAPKIFSPKKGFSKTEYISEYNSSKKYNIFSSESLNVSLPSSEILLLGRNVPGMIENFVHLEQDGYLPGEENDLKMEDTVFHFLDGAYDDIRFYANKPQNFLSMLLGVNLDLKLQWVKGIMKPDPLNENQYILDLTFNFKNIKYVKAGKVLLSIAFGLTDSVSQMDSPTELTISGIKLNKKQVYKLITF